MATESTLVGGKLVETDVQTYSQEYSLAVINQGIAEATKKITEAQEILAIWNARKTKLEELAG